MLNAGKMREIMELQKLAGMEKFSKLTVKQALDREKLIALLENRRCEASEVCGSMNKGFGAWYADHLIANDVVSVVRCKDCKHWKKCESSLIGEVMCCTGQGTAYIQKGAEDFCSCGERKTEDGKDYD